MDKEILVYIDEGTGPRSVRLLLKSLQTEPMLNPYHLRKVKRSDLHQAGWEEQCALLVFPGGRDIFYHTALQGHVNLRIRQFLKNGGCYLGFCAGGYYGCAAIEFEKGYPLEVSAKRELALFPGLARGSAYGPGLFCYENESGSCIAKLQWHGTESSLSHKTLSTYFNGGCLFVDAEKYPETRILATYKNLPQTPAAIIECTLGHGKAILSGVHAEYSVDYLPTHEPYLKKWLPLLRAAEPERKQLFRILLERLIGPMS